MALPERTMMAASKLTDKKNENIVTSNLESALKGSFDPQEHKDKTRSEIALYFVKGYFAIIVFVFVFVFIYNAIFQSQILDIIQVFTAVSGALSGLLGFVLGYYFKSEEGK